MNSIGVSPDSPEPVPAILSRSGIALCPRTHHELDCQPRDLGRARHPHVPRRFCPPRATARPTDAGWPSILWTAARAASSRSLATASGTGRTTCSWTRRSSSPTRSRTRSATCSCRKATPSPGSCRGGRTPSSGSGRRAARSASAPCRRRFCGRPRGRDSGSPRRRTPIRTDADATPLPANRPGGDDSRGHRPRGICLPVSSSSRPCSCSHSSLSFER